MMHTLILDCPRERNKAKLWVDKAPEDFAVRFGKATRTDRQNRWLWPHLEDLRRQVPEMAVYTTEQIKLRFMDALGAEMVFLPKLNGEGHFPVGMRSSTLTKAQFSALQELVLMYGEERGIKWSRQDNV